MLRLIFGLSKSGKTTSVLKEAAELAKSGKKSIILIPEQASFDTEIALGKMNLGKSAENIEVYSLTRLAGRIFINLGGTAGSYVSETGKLIAMERAISELRDHLSYFENASSFEGFSEKMLVITEEIHSSGLDGEQLLEKAALIDDEILKQKLTECALIEKTYHSVLENKFNDSSETLIRASKMLKENNLFEDYHFFIDGFMTFMAGEYDFIEELLRQSEEMTITIPSDYERRNEDLLGGFKASNDNARKLISIAKKAQIPVAVPEKADFEGGFESEELKFLAENFESGENSVFSGEINFDEESYNPINCPIQVINCRDSLSEVSFVASAISKLTKEGGARYNDIAVISRDINRYESYIEETFADCDIPVFMDKRQGIEFEALSLFILNSLKCAVSTLKTEDILSLGKSPCLGIDSLRLGEMQNYVYMWDIDGARWAKDFELSVKGTSKTVTEEDKNLLFEINETRKAIINPILSLKEKLKNVTGQSFANAVYEYINETNATEKLTEFYNNHPDKEEILSLNNGAYEGIITVLEEIALLIGEKKQKPLELLSLFKNCVSRIDIGEIPQTQDRVIAGSADRIRVKDKKYVFVIGANYGEFPAEIGSASGFSDDELEKLEKSGISIGNSVVTKSLYEKYYVYFALTVPSKALFVSFHTHSLSGEKTAPSEVVSRLLAMFKGVLIKSSNLPMEFFACSKEKAFEIFCDNIGNENEKTNAIKKALSELGFEERLRNVVFAKEKPNHHIKDKELAKKVFGSQIVVSPSQAENYFSCPFAYFCKKGLGLRPIRKIEFSPLESGTIIHYVLEKMLKENKKEDFILLTDEQIREKSENYLNNFLDEFFDTTEGLTERYLYLLDRLKNLLLKVFINIREEFKQSLFVPIEFEMKIGRNGKIPPLTIKIANDTDLLVEGTVDRVDIYRKGEKNYIRVIDYKSGVKEFDLSSLADGFDMQMLLYLFSVCKNYLKFEGENIPAGVLYLPARDFVIPSKREEEQNINNERNKKLKRSGIVLYDEDCLRAMEKEVAGVYIPAKTKKGEGFLLSENGSSCASLENLKLIEKYVFLKLKDLANGLLDGKIEACPIKDKNKNKDACQYCDYKQICGFSESDGGRLLQNIDKNKILTFMSEEVEKSEEELDN